MPKWRWHLGSVAVVPRATAVTHVFADSSNYFIRPGIYRLRVAAPAHGRPQQLLTAATRQVALFTSDYIDSLESLVKCGMLNLERALPRPHRAKRPPEACCRPRLPNASSHQRVVAARRNPDHGWRVDCVGSYGQRAQGGQVRVRTPFAPCTVLSAPPSPLPSTGRSALGPWCRPGLIGTQRRWRSSFATWRPSTCEWRALRLMPRHH